MWGDRNFDWKALNSALDVLYFWGNKIGRIGGQMKEKYGEARWYAHICEISKLSDVIYPGYAYYQWGADTKPFYNVLDQVSSVYMRPFTKLIYRYQRFMYAFAYRRAITKYPHIAKEIISCADHEKILFRRERELLKSFWNSQEESDDKL